MPVTITGTFSGQEWTLTIDRNTEMAAWTLAFSEGSLLIYNRDVAQGLVTRSVIRQLLVTVPVMRRRTGAATILINFSGLPTISRTRIVDFIYQTLVIDSPIDPPEASESLCNDCEYESAYLTQVEVGDEVIEVCDSCQSDNYAYCREDRHWVRTQEGYNWDYDCCLPCDANRVDNVVREWDWRPALNFHPLPPEGDHPLYIGMELEASFRSVREGRKWAGTYLPEYPDLLYAKEDSSVDNGFEIVTHPMQPVWAMENFPFHIFQTGIEEYGMFPSHDTTGTHVHMNKDAFDGPTLWKFLQIHMKLPEFCGVVGGRGTNTTFGSFTRHSGNFLGLGPGELLEIVKRKGKYDNPERYIAVNLRNEYTLELRYMRGGVTPSEIRKNIQWALVLFDFATYLDIRDVKDGALKDPGYLLGYINDRQDQLPDLVKWISKEIPRPISLRERT